MRAPQVWAPAIVLHTSSVHKGHPQYCCGGLVGVAVGEDVGPHRSGSQGAHSSGNSTPATLLQASTSENPMSF